MTNRSGKEVGSSSSKETEVEVSVPTLPKNEVVEEFDKEAPYVAPPPYKSIVPFL